MHLLRTEVRSLDETVEAVDLAQTPADIVVLSFSDGDLAGIAAAWEEGRTKFPSLRLASIAALRHPFSVDRYVESVLSKARFVLARLLGGLDYWRYGVEELSRAARRHGFALALVPGDVREDARLEAASTVPKTELDRLWAYFQNGGPDNLRELLRFLTDRLARPTPWRGPRAVPAFGLVGLTSPRLRGEVAERPSETGEAPCEWQRTHLTPHPYSLPASGERESPRRAPRALILLYRSALLASDTAPITALAEALVERGFRVSSAFVTSLKDKDVIAPLSEWLARAKPDVILNTTAFAARLDGGGVLDAADCPVLQVVLAGSSVEQWWGGARGLSAADLAMNVVLPELDGRILAGAISFKAESGRREALEFTRLAHRPEPSRIAHAANLAAAWTRLRRLPRGERRLACILSDYPGKGGRAGYAVGLDTPQSVCAIAEELRAAGYRIGEMPDAARLMQRLTRSSLDDRASHASFRSSAVPSTQMAERLPSPPAGGEREGTRFRKYVNAIAQSGRERMGGGPSVLDADAEASLSLNAYDQFFAALPPSFTASVTAAWGPPEADPGFGEGAFRFPIVRSGALIVALQPDRGRVAERKSDYHDAALPPRHAYIAFYLWLRQVEGVDAMIHCGTHGTLEWLPGKAVVLSQACAPEVVLGAVPVVYPFIVNNPGEAAQAKRRIAAVTIGHLTPPLIDAGCHGETAELEALFDEYASAQSLDQRRARLLSEAILAKAAETGLAEEIGLDCRGEPMPALAKLDAWLCDLKEMRIGDGLHVFGRTAPSRRSREEGAGEGLGERTVSFPASPELLIRGEGRESRTSPGKDGFPSPRAPSERSAGNDTSICDCPPVNGERNEATLLARSPAAEIDGLISALDGRFVEPGPAGAPSRGRLDVLPTGRNLFTIDPRAVPTRTAWEIGSRTAAEVMTRHAQEHGEWPRRVVIDLWGSASMRTGGDDLAQGFALLGVRPLWDNASTRVSGFEILPTAKLGRPRVDVTLRISGLFRDVFPAQIALFDQAVHAVAVLDEEEDDNPLAATLRAAPQDGRKLAASRIFGAAPGAYGVGVAEMLADDPAAIRETLGEAYLAATSHTYDGKSDSDGLEAAAAFRDRVAAADAFIHVQDMAGQDVLDADAFAEHEGGFSAAAAMLGAKPSLYHADTSRPDRSVVRTLAEEIARVVRGRASNPRWIAGQMRHGFRGAAEIAETVDNLFAFAAMTEAVTSRQFDLVYDATCGDDAVRAFLQDANPQAARAIAARFVEAARRGFWVSRRNSCAARLAEMMEACG